MDDDAPTLQFGVAEEAGDLAASRFADAAPPAGDGTAAAGSASAAASGAAVAPGADISDDPLLELLEGGSGGAAVAAAAPAEAPPAPAPLPAPDSPPPAAAPAAPPAAAAPAAAPAAPAAPAAKLGRAATQTLDMDLDGPGGVAEAAKLTATLLSTNAATAPDVPLAEAAVSVGRDEDATVRFDDLRVSAEQFVVRPRAGGGGFELEDRSRNGTIVSKKVVKGEVVALHDHDLIEVLPVSKVGRAAAIGFLFQGSADADAAAPPPPKRRRLEEAVAESAGSGAAAKDVFEGATCIICQDVLHRATSVQPCLHSFCSSCLSAWLRRPGPARCPLCTKPVENVARNHALSGLIEGLLKAHPDQQRSAKELADLDAQDALQEAGYDYAKFKRGEAKGRGRGAAAAAAPVIPAALPDLAGGDDEESGGGSDASGSGFGEEESEAEAGPRCFHCGSGAWRTLGNAATYLTRTPDEAAALALAALQGNNFERGVLEEWLRTVADSSLGPALVALLAEPNPAGVSPVQVRFPGAAPPAPGAVAGAAALPAGAWTDLHACRGCTTAVLHGLVYSVRERIPDGELPARASGRGKCWYGRQCRTQSHKPHHAERLDHICEQTRFR